MRLLKSLIAFIGYAVAGEDAGGAGLGLTIVQQLLLRCGSSAVKVSWAGFYLQCGIADRSFNPLKRAGEVSWWLVASS